MDSKAYLTTKDVRFLQVWIDKNRKQNPTSFTSSWAGGIFSCFPASSNFTSASLFLVNVA